MRTLFLLPFMLVSLSACIIVEEYGSAWDDATNDPCIDAIVAEYYGESFEDENPPYLAKRMGIGEHHMLLLKATKESKGGHAYRFTVTDNIFVGYKPNPAMLKTFRSDYADAPARVTKDRATLKQLSEEEQVFLRSILADESYWMEDVKILYNPRRNEQCSLYIPTEDDN